MLPLLITAFNRPDSLDELVKSIQSQIHGEIFIHCDGPRNTSDFLVFETQRRILDLYAKGIISKYYFQSVNLGLMDSIHFAVDWFFSIVERGLILEDDLVVNPPALAEAELLWQTVCNTEDLTVFSLGNPLPVSASNKIKDSYWCTNFFVSYAWCTSRETWKESCRSISEINLTKVDDFIKSNYGYFVSWNFKRFILKELMRETHNRKKCSFAWRFTLDQISKERRSIISTKNRIGYTGFGLNSTNTIGSDVRGSDFGKRVEINTDTWTKPQVIEPDAGMDYYFLQEFGFIRTLQSTVAIRTRARSLIRRVKSIDINLN